MRLLIGAEIFCIRKNRVIVSDDYRIKMISRILTVFSAIFLLIATIHTLADAYSLPVSWNPMSMPSVTYDQVTNKLGVETKPAAMLETNVNPATSQPGPGIGNFDPTKIWSALNGTAFSRMLGWNDPMYDYALPPANSPTSVLYSVHTVYGPGANIWIESTGKSQGLNNYLAVGMWGVAENSNFELTVDYGNPSGVPYSGIFGTADSSTRWHWDGLMDHNISSVSFSYLNTPSQLFTADYRLYIGDAAGIELLVDKNGIPVDSASVTTFWQWTAPPFVFTSQAGVAPSIQVESAPLRLTGMSAGAQNISISGGEYAISTTSAATAPAAGEWNDWTNVPGTVSNNYWVKVRQNSAPAAGITTVATLAIPALVGPGTFKVINATAAGATTIVPDVVGLTHSAAQAAIIAASLNVASISAGHSGTIPAGSVISQFPTAGSSVVLNVDPLANPNPAVDLVISLGPGIVVPNVVGLIQAAAETAIMAESGLSVGTITTIYSSTIPAGAVVNQNAPAYTVVTATDTNDINLVISLGPEPVNVPDIVDFTQTAAAGAITTAGLIVGDITLANSASVPAGSVISQTPLSGTSTASGSAVQLTVSLGPIPNGINGLPSSTLLSDAYTAITTGHTIKARETTFTGNLDCTLAKSVYLKGGYDAGFTNNTGDTILNGTLTIKNGTLRVEKIIIRWDGVAR